MDDLRWPRAVNEVLTRNWPSLKNTLLMKDFVDFLIQKRVITLDYWIGLKSRPVTESERMEDFLSLAMKFNRDKYTHFLEALYACGRNDLVKDLAITEESQGRRPRQSKLFHSVDEPRGRAKKEKQATEHDTNRSDNRHVKRQTSEKRVVNPAEISSNNNSNVDFRDEHTTEDAQTSGQGSSEQRAVENGTPVELSEGTAGATGTSRPPAPQDTAENPGPSPRQRQLEVPGYTGSKQEPDTVQESSSGRAQSPDTGNGTSVQHESRHRLQSVRSREEILDMREEIVRNKETELKRKEDSLKQLQTDLELRQKTLIHTRENTLVGTTSESGESTAYASTSETVRLLRAVKVIANHEQPESITTTQATEVYEEALRFTKTGQIVENESVDNEDVTCLEGNHRYVQLKDLDTIRTDIDGIREELATDRGSREILQQRVESQGNVVEALSTRIHVLEAEKESIEKQMGTEIHKLSFDLKNSNVKHSEGIKKIKAEIAKKESECVRLKSELGDIKKKSDSLNERVTVLEKGKLAFNKELNRYEKEVQRLQDLLRQKETEVGELRKTLVETEAEKEDLMDEVAELKAEVDRLKAEQKRLTQEKRNLLNRCVVPNWNQSTRRSSLMK